MGVRKPTKKELFLEKMRSEPEEPFSKGPSVFIRDHGHTRVLFTYSPVGNYHSIQFGCNVVPNAIHRGMQRVLLGTKYKFNGIP